MRRRQLPDCCSSHPPRADGFTLLELIVSLVIFSIMSIMAYQGLRNVMDARETAELKAQNLRELQKAFLIMERDFGQSVNRPVRDSYGAPLAPFLTPPSYEDKRVEFTRAGWRNPLGRARSDLQRVAYGLKDGKLLRYHWVELDRSLGSEPIATELLSGVEALELCFYTRNSQGRCIETWPPAATTTGAPNEQQAPALPFGIEVRLKLKQWGEISRLFLGVGT
ncbi:MAG: type II secretion system minor pseudopilin GspJ [Pseudomonadota bacterium]